MCFGFFNGAAVLFSSRASGKPWGSCESIGWACFAFSSRINGWAMSIQIPLGLSSRFWRRRSTQNSIGLNMEYVSNRLGWCWGPGKFVATTRVRFGLFRQGFEYIPMVDAAPPAVHNHIKFHGMLDKSIHTSIFSAKMILCIWKIAITTYTIWSCNKMYDANWYQTLQKPS